MAPRDDRAWDALEDLAEEADYSLVGPRDNRVHEIDTRRFPFDTICHLGRDFGDGRWRGCSAFLVAPRLAVTAAHCVYNVVMRRGPRRIRVVPGRRDRDTFPFGQRFAVEAYAARAFVQPLAGAPGDRVANDYGLIVIDRPFLGIQRFMSMQSLSDAELERLRHVGLITIAGYPSDRPTGTMWRHSERLKRVSPRRLYYTVDTCPGHSGSPIWTRCRTGNTASVLGIHTSGVLDEQGRPYGCRPDTVLAPPGLVNAGVRLTAAVMADIRNPSRLVAGQPTMQRVL